MLLIPIPVTVHAQLLCACPQLVPAVSRIHANNQGTHISCIGCWFHPLSQSCTTSFTSSQTHSHESAYHNWPQLPPPASTVMCIPADSSYSHTRTYQQPKSLHLLGPPETSLISVTDLYYHVCPQLSPIEDPLYVTSPNSLYFSSLLCKYLWLSPKTTQVHIDDLSV